MPFQSSPAPEGECNGVDPQAAGSSNPPLRATATVYYIGPSCVMGFNPHPPLRASATVRAMPAYHWDVSILTRP